MNGTNEIGGPPRAYNPRCAVCAQSCAGGVEYCPLTGEYVCGDCVMILLRDHQSAQESSLARGGGWRGLLKIGLLRLVPPRWGFTRFCI